MMNTASRWLRWLAGQGAGGNHRHALTRWFAVVGALAIGVFSVGMGWLLSRQLETQLLVRDAALSRDFVQSIANIQQVAGFLRTTRPPQPPQQQPGRPQGSPPSPGGGAPLAPPGATPSPPQGSVAEFFAHVAAMPDVLRANVYAPNRQVLWSSQPELIGKAFADNDELDEALAGQVVVNLDEDGHGAPKAEHQGLDATGLGYVENYLPVFDDSEAAQAPGAPPRKVIGVIEVYRQPASLLAAIRSAKRMVLAGAVAGGAGLFLVLLWFVRRTERVLHEQQQRLVEAETLAMVGELSAAVAHSIRNPLVSIRTSAELQREIDGDASGAQSDIMRQVDRIEHLVRTLLTYAGDPSEHQASADLGAVLRDTVQRFAPDLSLQHKPLALDIAADLGCVAADPVMLAQVFNSLLANAAEATASGDAVRVAARREGRHARIEVQDGGSGIAPEQLRDIFKPFFTTKPRGLGLGLPLARRIVRRLGGHIEVDSAPGRGTQIALTLPLLAEPAAATARGAGA